MAEKKTISQKARNKSFLSFRFTAILPASLRAHADWLPCIHKLQSLTSFTILMTAFYLYNLLNTEPQIGSMLA